MENFIIENITTLLAGSGGLITTFVAYMLGAKKRDIEIESEQIKSMKVVIGELRDQIDYMKKQLNEARDEIKDLRDEIKRLREFEQA